MADDKAATEQERAEKYHEFLANKIQSEITELDNISACEIRVQQESDTVSSILVNLTANGISDSVEAQIKDIVSTAFDVDQNLISIKLQ